MNGSWKCRICGDELFWCVPLGEEDHAHYASKVNGSAGCERRDRLWGEPAYGAHMPFATGADLDGPSFWWAEGYSAALHGTASPPPLRYSSADEANRLEWRRGARAGLKARRR